MRYADYHKLTDSEKKNLHWRKHPRVRVATIFTILFAVTFAVVMMRIFLNRRIHVNRKPNKLEAFTTAKLLIKDRLKRSATANFSQSVYNAVVDTAANDYQISSTVRVQDSTDKMVGLPWSIRMNYTGGDWADTKSWRVAQYKLGK